MGFERIGTSLLSLMSTQLMYLGGRRLNRVVNVKCPGWYHVLVGGFCPRTLELLLVWDYLNVTGVWTGPHVGADVIAGGRL